MSGVTHDRCVCDVAKPLFIISGLSLIAAPTAMQAIVDGFLSVQTCNGCDAAVAIYASSQKTAFVSAIAESKSTVCPVPFRSYEMSGS